MSVETDIDTHFSKMTMHCREKYVHFPFLVFYILYLGLKSIKIQAKNQELQSFFKQRRLKQLNKSLVETETILTHRNFSTEIRFGRVKKHSFLAYQPLNAIATKKWRGERNGLRRSCRLVRSFSSLAVGCVLLCGESMPTGCLIGVLFPAIKHRFKAKSTWAPWSGAK